MPSSLARQVGLSISSKLGVSDAGKKAELQRRLREARSSSKDAGGGDDLETALGGPEGVDAVFALLDAATLRMLKTVSASCLFEVRRVLSDATSSWRKSRPPCAVLFEFDVSCFRG